MEPFDTYPGDGQTLLPRRGGSNTRREDAPRLMRLTNQTSCAYCGVDLVGDYYRWLLTSLDHVVPAGQCKSMGIPDEWSDSFSNLVICCSGCNGFDNRYRIPWQEPAGKWTLASFFALRDRVFEERKLRIMSRRDEEVQLYKMRPWEKR